MHQGCSLTLAVTVILSVLLSSPLLYTEGAITGFSATAGLKLLSASVAPGSSLWTYNWWSTNVNNGPPYWYNDGSFNASNGMYQVPVSGMYAINANVFFTVTSATAPNQNIDLRLVQCYNIGCSSFPSHVAVCNSVFMGISQQGNTWLNDVPAGGGHPAYNPVLAWTGFLTAGAYISLCFENWSSQTLTITFPEVGITTFAVTLLAAA